MLFINTRPKNRAKILTEALQDKGLTVLNLPLLELVPLVLSVPEQRYQAIFNQQTKLSDLTCSKESYKALIVISPTAAQIGLAHCAADFIPSCSVIAVGHKTATVLRDAGWEVQCPDESSNEGMMHMPTLAELGEGDKVLIWRGQGGRRLLVDHLLNKSIGVHAIEWYLRQCPADAMQNLLFMSAEVSTVIDDYSVSDQFTVKPIVLVSSGEAFNNWQNLLKQTHQNLNLEDRVPLNLSDFNYLTLGKRLTDRLSELKLSCFPIQNLDEDQVWQGIERIKDLEAFK